jgi:hypothetical protein
MTTNTDLDLADKVAMYVGGGLVALGIVVMGLLNVLVGNESALYAYEVTRNGQTTTGHAISPGLAPEGAQIVSSPLFDPNVRASIVVLGLVVFGLYAVYRAAVHRAGERAAERSVAAGGGD